VYIRPSQRKWSPWAKCSRSQDGEEDYFHVWICKRQADSARQLTRDDPTGAGRIRHAGFICCMNSPKAAPRRRACTGGGASRLSLFSKRRG